MGVKTRKLGNINDQLVEWQAVHVADGSTALTTVAGRGYFIDTTSATQAVNLPANASSKLGDTIMLKDYARNWGTNAITLGSNTFDGVTNTPSFNTNGQTLTLIHMGGTKGWSLINDDTVTGLGAEYVAATGGTVTTSSDFKIHTFTGDSNFVVSSAGNSGGSNKVDYLVVAGGGGGGGRSSAGGGGAGGFRASNDTCMPAPLTSPLANPTGLTVPVATYPISVGGGGTAGPSSNPGEAGNGSNSVFSTITSTGGGGGSDYPGPDANPGGSGGGTGHDQTEGSGNTPPVSPPQGNPGQGGNNTCGGGGGGGAGAAGSVGTAPNQGGPGGVGSYMVSTGFAGCTGTTGPVSNTRYFAGGGGGRGAAGQPKPGGSGGGGSGAINNSGNTAGTANTGGGGGGAGGSAAGSAGGKGIVIIRYKFQN